MNREDMNEFFKNPVFPTIYDAHSYTPEGGGEGWLVEVPITTRRDWSIRTMIERAVGYGTEQVLEITKLLNDHDIKPLEGVSVQLEYPFDPLQAGGGEVSNKVLREFAFTAYDELNAHFEEQAQEWRGWFIAPYFEIGDDSRRSFNIGVFVDENIS